MKISGAQSTTSTFIASAGGIRVVAKAVRFPLRILKKVLGCCSIGVAFYVLEIRLNPKPNGCYEAITVCDVLYDRRNAIGL